MRILLETSIGQELVEMLGLFVLQKEYKSVHTGPQGLMTGRILETPLNFLNAAL